MAGQGTCTKGKPLVLRKRFMVVGHGGFSLGGLGSFLVRVFSHFFKSCVEPVTSFFDSVMSKRPLQSFTRCSVVAAKKTNV